ncbi:hypothetical protein Q3C01_36895 [Bradyrhizobium sp. UFLA05-109]
MSRTERSTVMLGIAGGLLALMLFALALATQGSQGLFQINRPAADYATLLVQRAPFLRTDLGLDFIFIVVYSAFFISLALVLKAWVADKPFRTNVATVVNFAIGAILITGVLDAIENAHLLAMLTMAEQGQSIGQGEIAGQMVESQIKFMFSYFGLFVLSFALPEEAAIEKLIVMVFRWIQLPVGIGIFVLPPELVRPLFIFRAIFFFAGLWAMAGIIVQRARRRA